MQIKTWFCSIILNYVQVFAACVCNRRTYESLQTDELLHSSGPFQQHVRHRIIADVPQQRFFFFLCFHAIYQTLFQRKKKEEKNRLLVYSFMYPMSTLLVVFVRTKYFLFYMNAISGVSFALL